MTFLYTSRRVLHKTCSLHAPAPLAGLFLLSAISRTGGWCSVRDRLPKGKLFSPRIYGKYGNYITWNMLKALATLAQPPSDNKPVWTSRSISTAVDMAHQPALLMLGRMKKMGWVEWGKDDNGKQAWVVTSKGIENLIKETHRRVNFEFNEGEPLTPAVYKIILRGMRILKTLKFYGWTDIQARECMINYSVNKIEWAIGKAERRVVKNKGAYVRALVTQGNMEERRSRIYLMKCIPNAKESILDMVLREALGTAEPFKSARLIVPLLRNTGKAECDLNKNDVEEVMFALYKRRKVKASARRLIRFCG